LAAFGYIDAKIYSDFDIPSDAGTSGKISGGVTPVIGFQPDPESQSRLQVPSHVAQSGEGLSHLKLVSVLLWGST
jgi:hypothetical protein